MQIAEEQHIFKQQNDQSIIKLGLLLIINCIVYLHKNYIIRIRYKFYWQGYINFFLPKLVSFKGQVWCLSSMIVNLLDFAMKKQMWVDGCYPLRKKKSIVAGSSSLTQAFDDCHPPRIESRVSVRYNIELQCGKRTWKLTDATAVWNLNTYRVAKAWIYGSTNCTCLVISSSLGHRSHHHFGASLHFYGQLIDFLGSILPHTTRLNYNVFKISWQDT